MCLARAQFLYMLYKKQGIERQCVLGHPALFDLCRCSQTLEDPVTGLEKRRELEPKAVSRMWDSLYGHFAGFV